MKSLRTLVILNAAVASLFSASLALADTAYESGASDQRGLTVVEEFRQRNLLGQSDAVSQTQPYDSLSLVNQAGLKQASSGADHAEVANPVAVFRENNRLSQSDALSKTRPYMNIARQIMVDDTSNQSSSTSFSGESPVAEKRRLDR